MGGSGRTLIVLDTIVIGATVLLWLQFATDLKFYSGQLAAICVDGRAMNETVAQSRVGVDDTERNKNSVTMKCSFPVAVYPCLDDALSPEEWNGQCKNIATTPRYQAHEWPRRNEDVDLNCCAGNCAANHKCSDKKWSCSNGACSAYEKTARLCAPKLRSEPYKCFTSEGEPELGVRDEAVSFPAGWLAGALVCTVLVTLPSLVFTFVTMSKQEDCMQNTIMCVIGTFLCSGVVIAIGFAINAAMSVEKSKGIVDHDYEDLAVTTGSAVFGTNQTTVMAETPPPEGMHWAILLLIVFASIYGCLCLGAGCFFAIFSCRRKDSASDSKPAGTDVNV